MKVHHLIYNCLPPVPTLSQIHPVHLHHPSHSHFLISHLHFILPSMLGSSKWSFSLAFPYQNPVYTSPLPYPMHATCPVHLILLNFITWTVFCEVYRSLSSSLCSFLHSLFTSSLLGPNILLSTLFSNILSLCSSLNVSNQISHPHKTTGKIIVLHILIYIFFDSKLEDQKFCI